MLISVIITCYNLENFIGESIQSVISQSKSDFNLQVVVVDDSSTDSSPQIIKTFPVHYVKTSCNKGVLNALVTGLRICKGEIICFIDGDDVWEPGKLLEVFNSFSANLNLVFLTHNYRSIGRDGCFIIGHEWTQRGLNRLTARQLSHKLRTGILNRNNYVWLGSAFSIRHDPELIKAFISWTKSLPDIALVYQDWPLAYWIASSCPGEFGYIRKPLFRYRIHGKNYSGDSSSFDAAVRNWRKSYFTSLAIVDISSRFPVSRHSAWACLQWLARDFIVLRGLESPDEIEIKHIFELLSLDLSLTLRLKESFRLLLLKLLGPASFYRLLRRISATFA